MTDDLRIKTSDMRPDQAAEDPRDPMAASRDPYKRQAQIFPALTAEQVRRVKPFARIEDLPKGAMVFARGERTVDFFLVLKGSIEIFDTGEDGPNVFTVHGPNQFTGELDLFNNREILVSGRMGADGTVARLNRAQFRRLLSAEPDIGEIIMRAFILRRVGLIEYAQGSVVLLGSRQSGQALRIERFLRRNGYPLRFLDASSDQAAHELIERYGLKPADLPAVIAGEDQILRSPTNRALGDALGLIEEIEDGKVFDVTVVGAGPSGLAAAVYAASEGLDTLVVEKEAPGGQAGTSSKIENYLGFPTGISGQALSGRAQVQAQKFGAHIAIARKADRLCCAQYPYELHLDDGNVVKTRSVIVASGARYRSLNLDNIKAFEGNGIHYAATAIEAGLCQGEEVIVVGGGNSAGQAAVFLSRQAEHVHILVRGEGLASSMSNYLIERIDSSDRITLHPFTEIVGLSGGRYLEAVTWRNNKTGETETRGISNVFLMIGAQPNTEWLDGCLKLDEKGFVCCGPEHALCEEWPRERRPYLLETSQPGIFAVGDVRSDSVKRVASAVGEGSIAIQFVHRVLDEV